MAFTRVLPYLAATNRPRRFGLCIMHFIHEHASYSPAKNFGLFRKSSASVIQPMLRRFAYVGRFFGLGIMHFIREHASYSPAMYFLLGFVIH